MLEFDKLKELYIKRLEEHIRDGRVDREIIHILNLINSLDGYFTTSSCAGRIVLIKTPEDLKKQENVFLFKSHQIVNFDDIWKSVLENYQKHDNIWFKQEPFILHIACKDLKHAKELLKVASRVGLKHSGIISLKKNKIMVEIIGNEKIETIVSKNKRLLINEEYMRELVLEANKKLLRNRVYMGKLYYGLIRYFKVSLS